LSERRSPTQGSARDLNAESEKLRDRHGRTFVTHPYLVPGLIILAIGTLAVSPLFFHFTCGVDSDRHFRWALQFGEALRERVLYPRWLGTANHDQGSPVMLYYPPLPFYIASAMSLFARDLVQALTMGCWLGMVLSGVTMYVFSRTLLARSASLLASGLYMIAPYRLFDLYQAGSLSEFWSFVWLPLVLHAIYRVATGQGRKAVGYLAVSYALLILTHIPVSFVTTLILPVYALLLTRNVRRLFQIAAGLALGLGIGSILLLPIMFERQYVRIGAVLKYDYSQFFLFKHGWKPIGKPLFFHDISAYDWVDGLKPSDYRYLLKLEQMSIGLPVLLATSTVLILVSRQARKNLFSMSDLRVATWAITTASLLMTTGATLWIWQVIPQLSYLQFPSRWLAITTAGISLIAAVAAAELTAIRRFRVPCTIALGAALALNLTIGVMEVQRAPFCEEPVDPTVLRREVPEYRPKWWDNKLHDDVNLSPVVVSNGNAAVTVLDDAGISQSYTVNAVSESTLTLRTLYFPGWVARVDGVPKQIRPSSEGRIQLTIEPGEHNIALAFEDTWPRTTGKYAFATCTLTALGLMFSRSRFRSGKSLTPSCEGNQHDPA
jgi:hypothetical protein